MNKRQRKKYLKSKGEYISNKEMWSLDYTIAKFIVPRLKEFKKYTNAYPGTPPYDSFEKWLEAIDKMIRAWEIVRDWDDIAYSLYDKYGYEECVAKTKEYRREMEEGLEIFVKCIQQLWW